MTPNDLSLSIFQGPEPAIQQICTICGVAGVSIGVAQRGDVLYKQSFGFRDVESGLKGDDDTIYYLGSMTKGFTAEAVGILVEQGKLKWTTPVKDVLPEFQPDDTTIRNQFNMVDLLSHRTGLEPLPTINQLRAVTAFRAEYRYNNWGFEVAGRVIEKLSGLSFWQFLSTNIFQPLGMARTFNNNSECHGADNVAKGYMTFDDASPCQVPRPHMADGTLVNPAGGIQSSVNDLLKYYMVLLKTASHQFETGKTSSPGSPLKQLNQVLSTNIKTAPRLREQSYAMGWARV
ncbi:hypothetical protein AK830_g5397 [Neonectria ditissima]|uniref:Beta-lactamase-related domain-containing protein n=1 Tax=Neonectria ditissima TaxID=78410 RepID=A0A0P7BLZ4_9HYPO|nr:hypothetical protein AK830_g5397 [Neonectria ditissima]